MLIRTQKNARRHQTGVSLIEVLIAVLVLAVGFVGYAAMQMLGIRTNNEALYRTQAMALAESMAERMYANRSAINDLDVNAGNSLYDGIESSALSCGEPPAQCDRSGDVAPVDCTVDQLVTFDAYSVFCGRQGGENLVGGIQDLLPSGTLSVACTDPAGCSPTSPHTVTVTWEETNINRNSDDEFVTRTVSIQVIP